MKKSQLEATNVPSPAQPNKEVMLSEQSSMMKTSKQVNVILMEHCYSRPHNWKPDSNFLRPTKTLFIPQRSNKKKSVNPLAPLQDVEDVIDIESVVPESPTIYDYQKATYLMNECDRYVACARVSQENEDWEESLAQ